MPYSVVLANAAKEALLSPANGTCEEELKALRQHVLARVNTIEHNLGRELATVRELLAILVRIYLNHTPELPESQHDPASISGRLRFARVRELLQRNVDEGISILDDKESLDVG